MGLRCSLLGHEYGDAEIEEDREERGNEVVVTVRELERCGRCGDERVLSENTEVTSMGGDANAASESAADGEVSTDVGEFTTDAAEDDGVILDDDEEKEEPNRQPGQWPDANVGDDGADRAEATDQGAADDEWPDVGDEAADATADAGAAEYSAWPEHDAEDEGFSADSGDGDAAAVEYDGLTPEVDAGAQTGTDAGEYVSVEASAADADEGLSSGITSTGPVEPTEDSVNAVLVCPECDFEEPATASSLRVGDICPDCRRGYLAERGA